MTTLATVALSCAKQLGRVNAAGTSITDLGTEIKEQIGETIRFYNRKSWHLTEFRGMTFKTAAGTIWQHTVGLTSGFGDQDDTREGVDANTIISIDYARLEPTGFNEPLSEISMKRFEQLQEGSTAGGNPVHFTLYAGAIGLWPTPSVTNQTIFLNGTIKPAVPATDEDTSIWFDEAGEMIEAGALKRVCTKYLRDLERAQVFAAIEQGSAEELHREYVRKTSSGKLTPHD